MRAILKREMKSYFSGPIGYVCIAVLLALSGLLYWQIMYTGSSSYIYMVYSNMFTYCMMVIPIITMKSLSDEQRNKTDQALLTAPVSVTAIVLGKFLAAFIVYAIAMTGTLLPCVAISLFGQPSWGEVFGYYLGSLFYGAAMISIGVFISSLTESQVIAAVLSFLVLFVTYVEEGIADFFPESAEGSLFAFVILAALLCLWIGSMIKNPVVTGVLAAVAEAALVILYFVRPSLLEGRIQDVFSVFDLSGHLDNFIYGILDLNGIVYYLSVIVLCLFFTVQSLQKRRWN